MMNVIYFFSVTIFGILSQIKSSNGVMCFRCTAQDLDFCAAEERSNWVDCRGNGYGCSVQFYQGHIWSRGCERYSKAPHGVKGSCVRGGFKNDLSISPSSPSSKSNGRFAKPRKYERTGKFNRSRLISQKKIYSPTGGHVSFVGRSNKGRPIRNSLMFYCICNTDWCNGGEPDYPDYADFPEVPSTPGPVQPYPTTEYDDDPTTISPDLFKR